MIAHVLVVLLAAAPLSVAAPSSNTSISADKKKVPAAKSPKKSSNKLTANTQVTPLPDHLEAALDRLGEPVALTSEERKFMSKLVVAVKAGDDAKATAMFAAAFGSTHARNPSLDIAALVQIVLLESYLTASEDLRFYADKVRHFNSAKKQIREHIKETRGRLQGKPETTKISVVPLTVEKYALGKDAVKRGRAQIKTVGDWRASITKLEEQLQTVGEDAQLANIDLQNALQKQQQTLQTMSNVSKMLHDTAMSVIRKIG